MDLVSDGGRDEEEGEAENGRIERNRSRAVFFFERHGACLCSNVGASFGF